MGFLLRCGSRCRFSESAICSSRARPQLKTKLNLKFKALRWRLLRWRLTLSECSLANRDKPVAATLQRKCSGGIDFVILTMIITKENVSKTYFVITSARMVLHCFFVNYCASSAPPSLRPQYPLQKPRSCPKPRPSQTTTWLLQCCTCLITSTEWQFVRNARLFIILFVRYFWEFVRNFGRVFAILFEVLLVQIQEEFITLLIGRGGV